MENEKTAARCILLGIPAAFLMGAALHFVWDWAGRPPALGLFVPVNESVFEHMKMVPLPMLLWWGGCALLRRRALRPDAWFTSALVSMLAASLCVPLLYYFYTGAFGAEITAVDIAILLAADAAGQLLGLHCYRYGRALDWRLALALMLGWLALFAAGTAFPPRLPLFRDSVHGTYGRR